MDQPKNQSAGGSQPHIVIVAINWLENGKDAGNRGEFGKWRFNPVQTQPSQNPFRVEREKDAFVLPLSSEDRNGPDHLRTTESLRCWSLQRRKRPDLRGQVSGG